MTLSLNVSPCPTPALELQPCDGCGAAGGLLEPSRQSAYCPDCTRSSALHHAALEQLHALLLPAVVAWAQHWAHHIPLTRDSATPDRVAPLLGIVEEVGEHLSGRLSNALERVSG